MNNIIKRVWNQNRMVNIEDLSGAAFQAEDGGHTFQISGIDDTGATVALSGTVAGVFRRPDNADIALTGAASGGVASVTLTTDCYAVPGRFGLVIYVTSNSQKVAVYSCVGTVAQTNGGAVAGSTPQDVVDLINAIEAAVATIPADYTDLMAAIAPMYSNSALYAVGSYAWYDGALYRCTTPITTAETWTAAHWTAAVMGNDVAELTTAGELNLFIDGTYTGTNWRGIVMTWAGRVATVSGTVTGGNFASPNIFYKQNAFPSGIKAGDCIVVDVQNNVSGAIYVEIISYVNGSQENGKRFRTSCQYVIPENATGMLIRLFAYEGAELSGNISFNLYKLPTINMQNSIVPIVLPNTSRSEQTIEYALNKYKKVVLGSGTYVLNRAITMPDNSCITGAGDSTIITAASGADAIIAGANCSIENVKLHSDDGHTDSAGTTAGIRITGNYDSVPLKYNIKISNVTIDGFSLAGIYANKTGTWVGDSISAINCTIFNCYAGLFLEDYSEFGRYTNIMCRDNYIGLFNKSGNNMFVNCSFSNNTVGVYLWGDDGDNSRNNGHGSVIGCTINHSNNNSGFAVICKGIDGNGFVFDSCQIWYGKVQAENSTGIIFNNCMFGAYNTDTEIINYTANDLFLMNCLFKVGATFSGSGGETHAINCFKFDGTPITV